MERSGDHGRGRPAAGRAAAGAESYHGGDASISAIGSTHREQTLETFLTGAGSAEAGIIAVGGSSARPRYSIAIIEHTRVGTLHIDIFDAQTKKVIWHGVCTDTLTGNPEKNEKKLDKEIAEVFKKFQVRVKG